MNSVLIVSNSEKDISVFMGMLYQNPYQEIVATRNCGEARRLLIDRDFDLCIINTPLPDEFGENLALTVAKETLSQVLIIVRSDLFDEISARVEQAGILTVEKPMDKQYFWNALKLANAAYYKINKLKQENNKLIQKIEDIRMIDRAKCVLIQYLNMSEEEAHKYIEKQAMDMRLTKRVVSERILKTYESVEV